MNIKQRKILRLLVQQNGQRYSQLYRHFREEDKFPYHLRFLIQKNLVSKRDKLYFITKEGMKSTAYFDNRTLADIQHKLPNIYLVCRNEDEQYLLNPHFTTDDKRKTFYALPRTSLKQGETLSQSLQELQEKYQLPSGQFTYRCTMLSQNYTSDNDILFDNISLIFDLRVKNSPSKRSKIDIINDHWFTITDIQKLPYRHKIIDQLILIKDKDPLKEYSFTQDYGYLTEDL